jgi:F-type H+-transporting ATPase subunit c
MLAFVKTAFGSLVLLVVSAVLLPAIALAEEAAAAATAAGTADPTNGYLAIGAGLAIGLAALGGGIGQGLAGAGALSGIARNPGAKNAILPPMILALALVESLVIYALIIAFVLSGKISV